MSHCPHVNVQVEATSRRVDVIKEGFDLAIRVRFPPLEDSDLTMKVLARSPQRLMAAPGLFEHYPLPETPADLGELPSLDFAQYDKQHVWDLTGPEGATARFLIGLAWSRTAPRRSTSRLAGHGVVKLAMLVGYSDLVQQNLVDVLPGWEPRSGILHAVFPSRRGLLPAVRAFLDFLDEHIEEEDFLTFQNREGTRKEGEGKEEDSR